MQLTSTTWHSRVFFFRYVHDVDSSKFGGSSFSVTCLGHFCLLRSWLSQAVVRTSTFVSDIFWSYDFRIICFFIFRVLLWKMKIECLRCSDATQTCVYDWEICLANCFWLVLVQRRKLAATLTASISTADVLWLVTCVKNGKFCTEFSLTDSETST